MADDSALDTTWADAFLAKFAPPDPRAVAERDEAWRVSSQRYADTFAAANKAIDSLGQNIVAVLQRNADLAARVELLSALSSPSDHAAQLAGALMALLDWARVAGGENKPHTAIRHAEAALRAYRGEGV